jgi:hypothetical protein
VAGLPKRSQDVIAGKAITDTSTRRRIKRQFKKVQRVDQYHVFSIENTVKYVNIILPHLYCYVN